ncbi:DUF1800 family protein [Rubritalea spongiae]|uniref:DUF1800 family protein n=1 Tax=Rubritalea spongiae TaxID=430797 RepID=A0ABW5E350_9BACT
MSALSLSSANAEYYASNATSNDLILKSKASHFLSQAAFGGTVAEIDALAARIQAIGHIPACEEWIDQQLALPIGTTYLGKVNQMLNSPLGHAYNSNASGDYWHQAWWDQVINSDDQLRHRMAFALSQICVVSTNYWNNLYRSRFKKHVEYYDMLMNNAFTSHRDLLHDVTYSPMMGVWLSHAQNAKADPELGTHPDENYAREVMQLFSCGVYAQDAYGNILTDTNGTPIENYDNDDIVEFAQVFTGLSINDQRGFFSKNLTLLGNGPMSMHQQYHDESEKHLLNGVVLPAGQPGNTDIAMALDNLADHPSTAPYFSRLLIQRFTSSNPSNDYVKRVTDAWYGNGPFGTGVSGDFKAVLKAILLDTEARDAINYVKQKSGRNYIVRANPVDELSGKIKEPLLKLAQFYRFAGATSDYEDGIIRLTLSDRAYGQAVLSANSVFNFYDAGHAPSHGPIGDYVAAFEAANPGLSIELTAPEAQILGQNAVGEFEQFYNIPFTGPNAYIKNDISVLTQLPTIQLMHDGHFSFTKGLIRYIDVYLCHGQLPYSLAQSIENDLQGSADTWEEQVAQIVSVIFTSPAASVAN